MRFLGTPEAVVREALRLPDQVAPGEIPEGLVPPQSPHLGLAQPVEAKCPGRRKLPAPAYRDEILISPQPGRHGRNSGVPAPFTGNDEWLSLGRREECMPCNAHNHPSDCHCGWGGAWHGNAPYGGGGMRTPATPRAETVPPDPATSIDRRIRFGDLHSLTIPNARCPVCGVSVFYYQNAHGSRVFFDELGPPWPKHPCTDKPTNQVWVHRVAISVPPVAKPKHRADWLLEGWAPYGVVRDPRKRGDRTILRSYTTGDYVEVRIEPSRLAGIPVVYARMEGARLVVSTIAAASLAPIYVEASGFRRLARKSALTGFPLHVEIEKRLWRELDAKAQMAGILKHRFSRLGLRRH